VDPGADRGGELTATSLCCVSCGAQSSPRAKFCSECGARLTQAGQAAEYKQVTVLFADVVGSMKLAVVLQTERLREVMHELFNRAATVVQRYQGTVDKFTGDGLMALFGAPVALEDHALRACIAALEIQSVVQEFADEVFSRDGVRLQLRVGLNSGEVIVGSIGSGPGRYTAVGHPVGMAQRMEAAAPAGGVLCSLSTARLVERVTRLGSVEHVAIKGADAPVPARQLLAVEWAQTVLGRNEGSMVGRDTDLGRLHDVFDAGRSRLVGVMGAPGVGKSRLIGEFSASAARRGARVIMARCEAHTTTVAFRAVARLLRAMFTADAVRDDDARAHVLTLCGGQLTAGSADAQIVFEVMGIADRDTPPLQVSVDGRRRRLVHVMSAAVLAQPARFLFVLEDAHWIDAPSDEVLADFTGALTATSSLFVTTYRPEFRGALRQRADETIALQPLSDAMAVRLVEQLVGNDLSLATLAERIVATALGNPFFIEEIVRDLADRGVISGSRGSYRLTGGVDEIAVPATVQAVLAARIDRLPTQAKAVVNAAAVIGTRFDADTLGALLPDTVSSALADLVSAELIDQTEFIPRQRYCFRHPLVRTVAYESQLSSTRAQAHRRLAAAIEAGDPTGADENAALIATNLEAAGELADAYRWHMRAAGWLRPRDMLAARAQWQCARDLADRLPEDHEGILGMRIAPRTMLISTALFVGSDDDADEQYREFRDMSLRTGDVRSFAIATAGRIISFCHNDIRVPDAVALASEVEDALRGIDWDEVPEIDIILTAVEWAYYGCGEFDAALAVSDAIRARPHDEPTIEFVGALTFRGVIEMCQGNYKVGRRDLRESVERARVLPPVSYAIILSFCAQMAALGIYQPHDLVDEMREGLRRAESFGDISGIIAAQFAYGTVLLRARPACRDEAIEVLEQARANHTKHKVMTNTMTAVGADLALDAALRGRLDEAIEDLRALFALHVDGGVCIETCCTTEALVELLIDRGAATDIVEARHIVDGWPVRRPAIPAADLWWLKSRALLAKSDGDLTEYAEVAAQYLELCERLDARGRLVEARLMLGTGTAEGLT
jgi:adenylate cyclase